MDNIEGHYVGSVLKMWKDYQKYLEKNNQKDPDFKDLDIKFE
jgi:hypothetical protein